MDTHYIIWKSSLGMNIMILNHGRSKKLHKILSEIWHAKALSFVHFVHIHYNWIYLVTIARAVSTHHIEVALEAQGINQSRTLWRWRWRRRSMLQLQQKMERSAINPNLGKEQQLITKVWLLPSFIRPKKNSLAMRRYAYNLMMIIFRLVSRIDILSIAYEIAHRTSAITMCWYLLEKTGMWYYLLFHNSSFWLRPWHHRHHSTRRRWEGYHDDSGCRISSAGDASWSDPWYPHLCKRRGSTGLWEEPG